MATRLKNAAATRDNILAAARDRFLQESYENVGLREIAGDAGVDVALIGRYFGSKEALFKDVLRGAESEWLDPDVREADLPQWLAALATREHVPGREREDIERLLIILRSASSPTPAEVVRDCFRENLLEPIAALLRGPDPELRASLALGLLMGTTVLRTVMSIQPLHKCEAHAIQCRLATLFAEALA